MMKTRYSQLSADTEPIPDGATALVRCVDVGRTYGTGDRAVVAAYGITCSVSPGQQISITGPSGSGKSTLLHILSGLEAPTVGTIDWPLLGGHPQGGARRVGLVFQAPSLIPSLTVAENVALPLLLAGCDQRDAAAKAEEALAMLALDGLRNDLPQELSGGQAQRVVIARVLAERPPLILADEPTSNLDRANAEHVADVLIDMSRQIGAALVIATHDPLVAGRLDLNWPMRDGRLHPTERTTR